MANQTKNGFIILHRAICEHWIWDNAQYLKWWIDIIMLANFKGGTSLVGGKIEIVPRGSFRASKLWFSERWKVNRKTAEKFLKLLESDGMIFIKSDKFGTTLEVTNYAAYQGISIGGMDNAMDNAMDISEQRNNITMENKETNEQDKDLLRGAETAPRRPPETQAVISLPLNDNTEHPITEEQCQEWAGLYPAVDVIQQFRNMRGWLLGNPTRRKTGRGIKRFINTWLSKEQDKGGNRYAPRSPTAQVAQAREIFLNGGDKNGK
jgi:hypothetical protein